MNQFTNHIKRHLTVQTAGHVVMCAFAAASLANVESFFAYLHPGLPALSWGLGVALGVGLVVMAGLLSGMVWDWRDARFEVVLGVTAGLALLSGGIQAAAYATHMKSLIAACVVGLALPIVGELGVALAVSAYVQAQRRQRMADAQAQLADGVRSEIGAAIAAIDKSKIEAQVNRAAGIVTREIVDATILDMIDELRRNRQGKIADIEQTQPPIEQPSKSIEQSEAPKDIQDNRVGHSPKTVLDAFNVQRQAEIEQRRQQVLNILSEHLTLGVTELHNLLGGNEVCTRSTLNNDLNALAEAGQVYNADRKWHIVSAIRVDLPALVAPTTNGLNGHH